jgi:hypothetical protein
MMSSDVGRRRTWTSEGDDTTARTGHERIERLPRPHVRSFAAPTPERYQPAVEECLTDRGGGLEAAIAGCFGCRHRRIACVPTIVGRCIGSARDRQRAELLLNEFADQAVEKRL